MSQCGDMNLGALEYIYDDKLKSLKDQCFLRFNAGIRNDIFKRHLERSAKRIGLTVAVTYAPERNRLYVTSGPPPEESDIKTWDAVG